MPQGLPRFAFDYASTARRTVDVDGRLHVACVPLTMAAVNVYLGSEIPDADAMGLDPNGQYRLLRDPDEIAKGAATFNNLPILSTHVAVSADDHRPDVVVGSTGTNARFDGRYLTNDLVVWSGAAIARIDSGAQRELSSGYRYIPIMEAGVYEGQRYDGRMTGIIANHVALVATGRAGPTVAIAADHSIKIIFPHMNRLKR